ncbi:dienelactone hydrolase [Akkermansiaceae bacterium]|nr:dienelactone hydrolase [Akkermansiaceae bacterium]
MIRSLTLLAAAVLVASANAKPSSYDPLSVGDEEVKSLAFDVTDKSRDRVIPIRAYLPENGAAAPLVIFSHGLGGSRDNNPYLGNHWAKRGYVVVFVQHPGSDESVWKGERPMNRMAAMKAAASAEAFADRVADIPAVIDALESLGNQKGHALKGRMDLGRIGMSGHSFGAVTTQAMAGQTFAGGRISYLEKRIGAAVMMSPSKPRLGDPGKAFGSITLPCLLLTGTRDDSPIGGGTPEDRLEVFPNLAKAPAWQLVFDGATHMDFGQRKGVQKDSRYHKAILALTTAFWDAHLKGDKAAMEWLKGEGVKSALAEGDIWQSNRR